MMYINFVYKYITQTHSKEYNIYAAMIHVVRFENKNVLLYYNYQHKSWLAGYFNHKNVRKS